MQFSLWTVMSVPPNQIGSDSILEDSKDDGEWFGLKRMIWFIIIAVGSLLLCCCIVFLIWRCRRPKSEGDQGAADGPPTAKEGIAVNRDLEMGSSIQIDEEKLEKQRESERMMKAMEDPEEEDQDEEVEERILETEQDTILNSTENQEQQTQEPDDHIAELHAGVADPDKIPKGGADAEVGFLESITGNVVPWFDSIRNAVSPPQSNAVKPVAGKDDESHSHAVLESAPENAPQKTEEGVGFLESITGNVVPWFDSIRNAVVPPASTGTNGTNTAGDVGEPGRTIDLESARGHLNEENAPEFPAAKLRDWSRDLPGPEVPAETDFGTEAFTEKPLTSLPWPAAGDDVAEHVNPNDTERESIVPDATSENAP